MEMSDIFLTLVGVIIAMLGWFMSRLAPLNEAKSFCVVVAGRQAR
jgi:hypothetical protein